MCGTEQEVIEKRNKVDVYREQSVIKQLNRELLRIRKHGERQIFIKRVGNSKSSIIMTGKVL